MLLGGEGADSEVFPGHQATRGSHGGCNSSSASILLSGPVPRACYCRCRAAFPPAPRPVPVPSTVPSPLHTPATLQEAVWGVPGLPHPARAPASFPLHLSSLPKWFLSPHPGFVFLTSSPSCKTASTGRSPHRVHGQKPGWLWPPRITTSILMSSHWDPWGRRNYPYPSRGPLPSAFPSALHHLPRVCRPAFSRGHPVTPHLPQPPQGPSAAFEHHPALPRFQTP